MLRYWNYSRLNDSAQPAPNATITVYVSGTLTLASIFSDASGTPQANPFTADASGYFFFYAPDGVYDVQLSGGGIVTPYTWQISLGNGATAGQFVSAESFGATGNGVTDDVAAFAAADAFATSIGGATITFFKGTSGIGNFRLGTSLTISSGNALLGATGNPAQFSYAGSGSAIIFEEPNFTSSGQFIVITTHVNSNAIEIQGNSRNATFRAMNVVGPASGSTGAAYYFTVPPGAGDFSYMAVMQSCTSVRFKYGIRVDGQNFGTETWTVIAAHDCSLTGNSSGIIAGSAGIYCTTNANCVASTFTGGTIESFADVMKVDTPSKGFSIWLSDAEGNTNQGIDMPIPDSFTGTVNMPQAAYLFHQIPNGLASPNSAWFRAQEIGGLSPIYESYYPPRYVSYTGSGDEYQIYWARGASLIQGGSPTVNFAFGQGGGSTQTTQLPYVQIGATQRIYVNSAVPVNGAWSAGTLVVNTDPASGSVGTFGWYCVSSGDFSATPPTFVKIPFEVEYSSTINPGSIGAGVQYETTVTVGGWGFTTGNAFVTACPGADTTGLQVTCRITGVDTVTVSLYNPTGSPIVVGSSSWKFRVSR